MSMKRYHISKSLCEGFREGFTAYYDVFRTNSYPRTSRVDASVGKAWRDVGDALRQAESTQRGNLGEKYAKATGKSRASV